jgi:natural product biosynthesis luciferase-like monooxygenase protein
MEDVSKRLAALAPEQRRLLELRLKQQGLSQSLPVAPVAPPPTAASGEGAAVEDDSEKFDQWKGRAGAGPMQFGLYFFSDDGTNTGGDKYRLLLESARFADEHGFAAVWTPERHFQDFGGLYPNPAVLSAALAVITKRIQIRAGSVALPLHHPVRAAEEWAVVDNLSKGRVGVSIASGWHPNDFILAPENYERRKDVMYESIAVVQRLWAGEAVGFKGVNENETELRSFPRPIQPRLPVWVTTAGSAETWAKAGEIGANILAALVAYSPDDLREKIELYRRSRARHGHDPGQGIVSVMAHTLIGESNRAVKEMARAPLMSYLRIYINQFVNFGYEAGEVTEEDKQAIVAKAFEHYFEHGALIGTPGKCSRLIDRLIGLGVNDVACLIDFGLDFDSVMRSLGYLNELRAHYAQGAAVSH